MLETAVRIPLSVAVLCCLATPAVADSWSVSPGLNLQYDWLQYRADRTDLGDADEVRRARFALTARYGKAVELKAEYDAKATAWTDVFARWNLGGAHAVRAGQFKVPIYLDELRACEKTPTPCTD